MSRRWILALAFAVVAAAQKTPQPREQEPPEEDESLVPKVYSFNPLQAAKEVKIGNYYFKKGNYRAAAQRFLEATRWDGTLAEAFLRLGEAREKQHDKKGSRGSVREVPGNRARRQGRGRREEAAGQGAQITTRRP